MEAGLQFEVSMPIRTRLNSSHRSLDPGLRQRYTVVDLLRLPLDSRHVMGTGNRGHH
jgi:hypothetical protein